MLVKFDWNINESHRASLRLNKTEQTLPILPNFGSRSLSLSSHWYANIREFESSVFQLYSDWTPAFSTEVSFTTSKQGSTNDIGTPLPAIQICLNSSSCSGADSLWIGTERFRHVNIVNVDTTAFFAAGSRA